MVFEPLLLLPLLWLLSLYLLSGWRYFWRFFQLNALLVLLYLLILFGTDWVNVGHDEYGLRRLTYALLLLLTHLLLGLEFAFLYYLRRLRS